MRIQSAELQVVAGRSDQFPPGDRPEVAFAGRSNVGKSSLINRLVGRRSLAHTSSTPGRTRTLNFYRLNEQVLFVDLPGYGYAKVSRVLQESWWAVVEAYLTRRPPLRGVVHLVDARHPPSALDQDLREFLLDVGLASVVVLTKADKLSARERGASRAAAAQALGAIPAEVLFFSAATGEGLVPLWQAIDALLRHPPRAAAAHPSPPRAGAGKRPETD
jgi:GTP-binding protein